MGTENAHRAQKAEEALTKHSTLLTVADDTCAALVAELSGMVLHQKRVSEAWASTRIWLLRCREKLAEQDVDMEKATEAMNDLQRQSERQFRSLEKSKRVIAEHQKREQDAKDLHVTHTNDLLHLHSQLQHSQQCAKQESNQRGIADATIAVLSHELIVTIPSRVESFRRRIRSLHGWIAAQSSEHREDIAVLTAEHEITMTHAVTTMDDLHALNAAAGLEIQSRKRKHEFAEAQVHEHATKREELVKELKETFDTCELHVQQLGAEYRARLREKDQELQAATQYGQEQEQRANQLQQQVDHLDGKASRLEQQLRESTADGKTQETIHGAQLDELKRQAIEDKGALDKEIRHWKQRVQEITDQSRIDQDVLREDLRRSAEDASKARNDHSTELQKLKDAFDNAATHASTGHRNVKSQWEEEEQKLRSDVDKLSTELKNAAAEATKTSREHQDETRRIAAEAGVAYSEACTQHDKIKSQLEEEKQELEVEVARLNAAVLKAAEQTQETLHTHQAELQMVADVSTTAQTDFTNTQRTLQTQVSSLSSAFEQILVAFLQRPGLRQRIRNLHRRLASQASQIQLLGSDHATRMDEVLRELNGANCSLLEETRKRKGYEKFVDGITQRNISANSRIQHLESLLTEQQDVTREKSQLVDEFTKRQSCMRQHTLRLGDQVSQARTETVQARERATEEAKDSQGRHATELREVRDAADARQREADDREDRSKNDFTEERKRLAQHVLTAVQSMLHLEERHLSPSILDEFLELEGTCRTSTETIQAQPSGMHTLWGGLLATTDPMIFWLAIRLGGQISLVWPSASIWQAEIPWLISTSRYILQERESVTAKQVCMHLHHLGTISRWMGTASPQGAIMKEALADLGKLEIVNKSAMLMAMQVWANEPGETSWITGPLSSATAAGSTEQVFVLNSDNSDIGNLILMRDPHTDLFCVLQHLGQQDETIVIFEYNDIAECRWAQNETVTLCVKAGSGIPEDLKNIIIQRKLVPGTGVLAWIMNVEDLMRFL